jgi:sulfhydrogenase subunit gamma (sulfur reductase)
MTDTLATNPMLPYLGKLVEVKDIATEIKLIRVAMQNGGGEAFRDYKPGQFAFVSAFGVGEAPFGIANIPENGEAVLDFAINRLGSVTTDLHELGVGDMVGVRGPMGNGFPMEKFKGKNLVVIGGGIGGAPLRPVIQSVMANRSDYGDFLILWAARNPSLLVFTDEYDQWRLTPNTELHLTVDQADSTWKDNVGLITQLLEKVSPSPRNTVTITCGPPIMIHFVNRVLVDKLNFKPEQNYVTLEARMHCGIGKCGRCNLGTKLVCVDGPVFTMAEVGALLESFL